MLKSISLSHISAGFVTVLVGYTSSVVIIFQTAVAAGATPEDISSWLWALGIGMGLTSIGFSLFYRMPIITAWSTPGAALLITGLEGISLNEAIGVFLFSSALITLCGLTGIFERLIKVVPKSIASAMLAGVLLPFGMNTFDALTDAPLLVGCMILVFVVLKKHGSRYLIPLVLAVGILITLLQGDLALTHLTFQFSKPIFTLPEFHLISLIGVGVPLFVVTMTSQNVPGIAALRANDYQPPSSPLITWTGVTGLVLAPFGGFAFNLAAITAAICMGPEVDKDPQKRYFAGIFAGLFYLFTGIFGATVAALFALFPSALIMAIAGLALLSTIGNNLYQALLESTEREAALMTFLVTASGVSFFNIGSAFWGLCIGMVALELMKLKTTEQST